MDLDDIFCCYIALDCGKPDQLNNGHVIYTGTTFGSVALYICKNGFILTGNAKKTCRVEANKPVWSPDLHFPDCLAKGNLAYVRYCQKCI